MHKKPRVAIHKFSSCDGCQLAFLNLGKTLLDLAERVDIVHFAEAGMSGEDREVDIAFVEGSISTARDIERIRAVRQGAAYLVTIGACATSGGIQALRNQADAESWRSGIYPEPGYLDSLATSTPISAHVKVDLELWGCPVSSQQVLAALRQLLSGVVPSQSREKVCAECKRRNNVCVMVTQGIPCMGVITRAGCGAICPGFGRDCYGCYGPTGQANVASLARRCDELGLDSGDTLARLRHIHSEAEPVRGAVLKWEKDA